MSSTRCQCSLSVCELLRLRRTFIGSKTSGPFDFTARAGFFKKALSWMHYAERERFDAVVLLIDEDGDRGRVQQIDDAQDDRTISRIARALGVAIQTFDAWFLADKKALSEALESPVNRQPDPETDRAPKTRCKDLVGKTEAGLDLGELFCRCAQHIELKCVEQRCPRGFAPFAERVRQLEPNSKYGSK